MSVNKKLSVSVIAVTIAIVLLFVLDLCTSNVVVDGSSRVEFSVFAWKNFDVKSFFQTLLSSLLGILLSLFVMEQLLNKSKEDEISRRKELRTRFLLRTLAYPLKQYRIAAISITNCNSSFSNKVIVPVTMEALCDIYKDQFTGTKRLWMKKIEYYAEAVSDLKNAISNIVLNADLTDNPDLDMLCCYLEESPRYDTCNSLISLMHHKINIDDKEKTLAELFVENLPIVGLDIDSSNECYKFVLLKKLIEYHDGFIQKLTFLVGNKGN